MLWIYWSQKYFYFWTFQRWNTGLSPRRYLQAKLFWVVEVWIKPIQLKWPVKQANSYNKRLINNVRKDKGYVITTAVTKNPRPSGITASQLALKTTHTENRKQTLTCRLSPWSCSRSYRTGIRPCCTFRHTGCCWRRASSAGRCSAPTGSWPASSLRRPNGKQTSYTPCHIRHLWPCHGSQAAGRWATQSFEIPRSVYPASLAGTGSWKRGRKPPLCM